MLEVCSLSGILLILIHVRPTYGTCLQISNFQSQNIHDILPESVCHKVLKIDTFSISQLKRKCHWCGLINIFWSFCLPFFLHLFLPHWHPFYSPSPSFPPICLTFLYFLLSPDSPWFRSTSFIQFPGQQFLISGIVGNWKSLPNKKEFNKMYENK